MGWIRQSAGRHPQLGPLETRLLGLLSQRRDATVRELLGSAQVDAAYTTVMTTLDRLYKKGFLDRSPDALSRAFRYRLKQGERDLYRAVLGNDLHDLLQTAADPSLPVSFLVDAVTEHDPALLEELRRAVERKRQQLRRRKQP
ncbi:MAG TPA: BlaI/MecI/CopY family transcriptional regulator [Terriglobales bacterium]|nr:BlaI/MecI/CopY family transcriptional regulator [Terriglobales bacterium]